MADEMKLTADIGRARRAQELLENELLVEAFEALEQAYISRWRATHIDDDKGREKLFVAINVVGKVRDHLSAIVNMDGKMAAAQLKGLAEDAQRKKRYGII